MSGVARLPEGLAHMPAGPELAVALAGVDIAALSGAERYTLVATQARQAAHEQARLLSMMLTTAYVGYHRDDVPPPEQQRLDGFSGDELAFTLRWSRVAVNTHLDLVEDLTKRLPRVYEAFLAGHIDLPKARAFHQGLDGLSDKAAQGVADRLLPKAQTQYTVGQLRERLRYWALKADPSLARAKARYSVTQRRVYTELDHDGTATLAGICLPPDRAAAAADRVDRLARAAKADGDARTLAQLRADAMLALLSGAPFTLRPPTDAHTHDADTHDNPDTCDPQLPILPITIRMTAAAARAAHATRAQAEREQAAQEQAAQAAADAATNPAPTPNDPAPAAAGPASSTGDPDTDPDTAGTHSAGTASASVTGTAAGSATASATSSAGTDDATCAGGWDEDWPVVEPDEQPDPGEGFQLSEPGYPIGVAGVGGAPLAVRSGDGAVDLDKVPTPEQPNLCVCGGVQPAPRRGSVDLQVRLETLMCLSDDPGIIPGWGPVIADIARQVAFEQENDPLWRWSVTDERGALLHHGHTRRRPNAAERDFVRARDRTCRAPGCRRAASSCDLDHRREYANGGISHRTNLCTLCRHCHLLRHTHGFVAYQIHAGTYLWESPTGRLYLVNHDGDLLLTADDLDPASR